MSHPALHEQPLFRPRIRWAVRVLAWIALGLSAYLTWASIGHLPIAGCTGTGLFDCDAVHNSPWSRWLSLPVAIGGLACYASLAGLSVLLGWTNLPASRWLNTLVVLLSAVAGGAAIWFAMLQVAVIGSICVACMAVHGCGIALAILVLWSTIRWLRDTRPARISASSLAALRTVLPAASRSQQSVVVVCDGAPLLNVAISGAAAVLAVLIGGQILFPTQTYTVETVALDQPINIGHSDAEESIAQASPGESMAQPHTALRVSSEPVTKDSPTPSSADPNEAEPREADVGNGGSNPANLDRENSSETPQGTAVSSHSASAGRASGELTADAETAEQSPGRVVQLLNGKLTLDVTRQPILGSPDAPYILVELLSYDCLHCRQMHRIVQQARQKYGDQLAIIVLPVPLEASCNKYVTSLSASHHGSCTLARFAMAVATVEPAAFSEFHDWLMADEEKAPPIEEVTAKAYRSVDRERLRALSYSDELKKKISNNVELFAALQKQHSEQGDFALPIQILGDRVMSGVTTSPADVFRIWEEQLGIKPR